MTPTWFYSVDNSYTHPFDNIFCARVALLVNRACNSATRIWNLDTGKLSRCSFLSHWPDVCIALMQTAFYHLRCPVAGICTVIVKQGQGKGVCTTMKNCKNPFGQVTCANAVGVDDGKRPFLYLSLLQKNTPVLFVHRQNHSYCPLPWRYDEAEWKSVTSLSQPEADHLILE